MKKILFIFGVLFFSFSFANEKETSKIPKNQFCHFAYSIYQGCYQRGLQPGIKCGELARSIKFGKAFLNWQKEYITNVCKTGCFLGKNKFKPKSENQFVSECIAAQ